MSGVTKKIAKVSAVPFQVIFLLYCALFGIVLKEAGISAAMAIGVAFFVGAIGIFGLDDFREQDVPLAAGSLYLIGVMVGLLLYNILTSLPFITASVFTGLFVLGIVANVFYFLSENQKLSYLNGQISEEGITLRRVERFFPLWLIILCNILLVFVVTPLMWASLHQVAGSYLFVLKTKPTLFVWFTYLIENINQSLLGVASLLGLSLPQEVVVPTGIGRVVVFIFRIGILSLGLGAIKRYLDLRATTRHLLVALGRASLEQEQWELCNEGKRSLHDKDALEFENRRQMWQLRLRQLIQLYPAQLDRLVSELTSNGDWWLRIDARLHPRKDDPIQADHLGDWIRSEIADMFSLDVLFEGRPAERQAVIRALLQRLQSISDKEFMSSRLRRRLSVSLSRMVRAKDPERIRQQILLALEQLMQMSDRELGRTDLLHWPRILESRARLATTYAMLALGKRQTLEDLLPAFQFQKSALGVDVRHHIHNLVEQFPSAEATILSATERLLTVDGNDAPAVSLAEMLHSLRKLPTDALSVYQLFVAKALVLYWYLETDQEEDLFQPTARLLLWVGEKNASQASWRIVQSYEQDEWRHLFLQLLVEGGLAAVLGSFFRHKLGSPWVREQALAAELMTALPVDPKNIEALEQMASHTRVDEEVRWRCFCSLATLGQASSLPFLESLQISETSQTRLWAAWMYAKASCGQSDSLPLLLDTLADFPDSPSSQAIQEVFLDRRPLEVESIGLALDVNADEEARLEACENLVGRQSPLALLILGRLLRHADTPKKIRQAAAEDLGILGRSMRTDQLGLLCHSKSAAEWAAEPLLHALENDDDKLVRIRAARALGRLGLPDVRKRFQQALLDPSENAVVRQVVAQAVGEMGDVSWLPFLLQRFPQERSAQVRQGMLAALDQLGADANFFFSCLEQDNAKMQQLCLQALSVRRLDEAQKHKLLAYLDASHKDVRAAAADTLGAQHYEPAIPALQRMAWHENESEKAVRRSAIDALDKIVRTSTQKEDLYSTLEKVFLEDPDHLVVQDCAAALSHLYGERVSDLLLAALHNRTDHEAWMKGFAGIVRALGKCANQEAQDYLFDQLRKQLKSEVPNIARLNALLRPAGAVGGSRALPILFELVQKNNEAFSWVAVQVMADIGDPQIFKPLQKFLEYKRSQGDLEPNLEAVIMVTLVRMGGWDYLEELVSLLRDTSTEREVARRRALGVLPELQVDLSSMLLMMAMSPQHTPHEKIRETAVRSLGQMVSNIQHQVQALQWQAQADPRAKIREAAQQSLKSIENRTSRNLQRFIDQNAFDAKSYLTWGNLPIHPAWQDQWEKRRNSSEVVELKFVIPGEEDFLPTLATIPTTPDTADTAAVATPVPVSAKTPATTLTTLPNVATTDELAASVAVVANVSEPEAQLTSPASAPVSEPTEPVTTPTPQPEPQVSAFEQVVDAVLDENAQKLRTLSQQAETQNLAPLWENVFSLVDDLRSLHQKFGDEWVMVTGEPEGEAAKWPFLVMTEPVNMREYADFCAATDRPLPRRWTQASIDENSPATNLKWYDADAFAHYKGWQLPTHEQLALTFGNFDLFSLSGYRIGWMIFSDSPEWTSSTNSSRRQLVRLFSTYDQYTEHVRRDTQSFDIAFRCVFPVDARLHPVMTVVLEQGAPTLLNIFYSSAQHLGLTLPEDTTDWATYLEQISPDTLAIAAQFLADAAATKPATKHAASSTPQVQTVTLHDTAQEPQIQSTPKTAEPPTEQSRLEAAQRKEAAALAAQLRREQEAARKLAQAEENARLQRERRQQEFWQALQDGRWQDAALWLQQHGTEFFAQFESQQSALSELCAWLDRQQGMVWVAPHTEEAQEQQDILLLQEHFVSRRDFHQFCLEHDLPMSPRWKGGKHISEPHEPVTDISLLSARDYAAAVQSELPSLEQLEQAISFDLFERTYLEFTNTHYPNNARLFYSFDLTAAQEEESATRTLRRDEPAAQTSFRLSRTVRKEQLPELLQAVVHHLPSAFPVDRFPKLLGPALKVYFSHRLQARD